ncbi:MAG: hypothetical protein DMD78_27125 [Candidatus Rokuibacteriota bacterium]|nr:MAG: hypothetical protein DMD78_27125 [Candidatus Rokubacteria bacterium]
MTTSRRSFLRIAGLAAASTLAMPHHARAGRAASPLQRFVATLQPGAIARHGALTLVWLHGGEGAPLITVVTLDEAQASGELLITEHGSATVPELIVNNRGKAHVLMLAGEILVGGKQNRVLREDILLPPLSGPRPISVYCVEQGRWSGSRKEFQSKSYVAQPSLRRQLLEKTDQHQVWAEVDRSLNAQGLAAVRGSSYARVYESEDVAKRLDDGARGLEAPAPHALGAMVLVGQALGGLDAFHDAGLFGREWRKLLRAHLLESYGAPPPATLGDDETRQRARTFLGAVAGAGGSARGNAGVGQLFEFRGKDFRGTALDHEGRVVHLAVA